MAKLLGAENKCNELEKKNKELGKQVASIVKEYEEYKTQQNELSHQQEYEAATISQFKLEMAKLQAEFDQSQRLYENLEK